MCAKLRIVTASNNRVYPTRSLYYCLFAPHIYGFVLRAHPVRGESRIQRNTTGEVATVSRKGEMQDNIKCSSSFDTTVAIAAGPGTEFAKKLSGGQSLLFAFRWRHHIHSAVVRPFCKIRKMGSTLWNWYNVVTMARTGYAHRGGIATSSIYKYTMVLCLDIYHLALHLIWKHP